MLESNGSTDVVEFTDGGLGVTQATALGDHFPFEDSYQVVLTKQPAIGESVTITVQADPTRTSQTGGIFAFSPQVRLCVGGVCETASDASFATRKFVTFTNANWDVPQTVWVRAIDDNRVDGQDTQVFAPYINQLNNIQGPLFINGAQGTDRTGLLEREPVMLPGELNQKPSMGLVISATPGAQDGSVAATITINPSQLHHVYVTPDPGSSHTIQQLAINAVGGTFRLSYGLDHTGPLAFDAPSVTIENALKALPAIQALLTSLTSDLTVSSNSNVYQVTFIDPAGAVTDLSEFDAAALVPQHAADLVNFTIEITGGSAKNKTRIVTAGIEAGPNWVLTLDKAWYSPFTQDSTVPDSGSTYTLETTNPNLLVKEETQSNLLFLYDTDNPGSFDDAAYHALHPGQDNPFAAGRLFYDTSLFGPPDENGIVYPLNQFRIVGFGMALDRIIGNPFVPTPTVEPGGITYLGLQNIELNLGAGNNHVTIDSTSPGTLTKINTGAGADVVDVTKIQAHTIVNLGAGNDIINIHNAGQKLSDILGLLTVSGDSPQANVLHFANGSRNRARRSIRLHAIQRLTIDLTGGTFRVGP